MRQSGNVAPAPGPLTPVPDNPISRSTAYQVAIVVLAIATIQMLLPDEVTLLGAKWLIPAIEVVGAPAAIVILQASGMDNRVITASVSFYLGLLVMASVLNACLLHTMPLSHRAKLLFTIQSPCHLSPSW